MSKAAMKMALDALLSADHRYAFQKEAADAAIESLRAALAEGEPTGERAELLHLISGHIGWANGMGYEKLSETLHRALDMLEADAEPDYVPLTDGEIKSIVIKQLHCVPLPYDLLLARAIEKDVRGMK
jgi:hypothetical protein